MRLPDLDGVLRAGQVRATAESIAELQAADGSIPWSVGEHTDPWNHVEAAMGLDVGGLHDAAGRAYDWLVRTQRRDGTWATRTRPGCVEDASADSNQVAYVAVGAWHHALSTGDRGVLGRLWPAVRAALDAVLALQAPGGEIWWAQSEDGEVWPEALLTGCASTYQSLRCGLAIAEEVGEAQPGWELAAGQLGHAVAWHPERFEPKERWAMDWYYPVLGGAVRGTAAAERLVAGWPAFVVDGLGVRCVSNRPWVTGAETCELALVLDATGERDRAAALVTDMQHLRAEDGAYWTGLVFDEGVRWPAERTTWTAAAVLLAVDALDGRSRTARLFHGDDLPTGVEPDAACDDPSCPAPGRLTPARV